MEKRVVDVWMQHPSKTFLAHPVFDALRRWSHGGLPDVEIPLEATIQAMDEAGVRLGLICAWWGPQGPLISNDEVATFVRRHPDRLVGVASVDLCRPMDAVRELRRCVRELGFRALRIVPWLWNLPPDDRRYPRELVDYLRAHGRKKVLFGSNPPAWPAKDCLQELETLELDPETQELFLYKNAERVFSL